MLVLISFALVLVGAVTLVAGLVASGLPLIYVSIACTVTAGIVLVIAVRQSRPEPTISAAGPAPLEEAPPERVAPAAAATAPSRAAAEAPDEAPAAAPAAVAVKEKEEEYFPILAYADLSVSEIIPLLDELDAVELEMVREREVAGDGRVTVVRRIDELLEEPDDAWAPEDDAADDDAAGEEDLDEEEQWDDDEDDDEEGEWSDDEEEYFPIADYDDLNVSDITPLLEELDDDELEMVRDHEAAGARRASILRAVADLLGEEEQVAKKAPAKKRGTKKRAPAKKRGAKKRAPAKKRGAKKRAPAKKRAAKKRAARRR